VFLLYGCSVQPTLRKFSNVKVVTQSAEVISLYKSTDMITLISIILVDCYQRKCLCLCNDCGACSDTNKVKQGYVQLFKLEIGVLFLFMLMGRDYVSELLPLTGLFFIPQMIYEYGEPQWNGVDGGNRRTRR
jgi:hypothetical protein